MHSSYQYLQSIINIKQVAIDHNNSISAFTSTALKNIPRSISALSLSKELAAATKTNYNSAIASD